MVEFKAGFEKSYAATKVKGVVLRVNGWKLKEY